MATTLEILAPYLPYGIELQWQGHNGRGGFEPVRRKMHALSSQHARVVEHAWAVPLTEALPVLRPFSQLCDPLPDGTVPLLEVFKLALPNQEGFAPIRETSDGEFYAHALVENKHVKCWITDEWDVQLYGWGSYEPFVKNQPALLDYLRSRHFAVGLEPHQYLPMPAAAPAPFATAVTEGGQAL